ncbi:MAG: HEAT repeat domain-containing protein [Planctomycetes bacterium]|nr:HEAT repeat domain-containing protein [Planctomycetota bacterium]
MVTLEAAAGAAAQRRQLIAWLVASAVVASILLAIAAVVLWYRLPQWAPQWVVQRSPWMRPLLRAEMELRNRRETSESRFPERMRELGQRAGPSLVAALSDGQLDIRLLALEGLQDISYAPAVPRLVDLLGDHQQEEAAQAEGALMTIADPGCTAVVLSGLGRVDDEGRVVLLTWLSEHGDQRGLLPVAKAYWQRAHDGADAVFDYDGLFRRVYTVGDAATIREEFRPMLKAAQPAWRMAALTVFGDLGAAAAAPDLVAGLIDEDEKVRVTAYSALHRLDEACPGVIAAQMPALVALFDPQPGLSRRELACMLDDTRDARAVQALVGVLRTHAWDKATRDQALDDLAGNDDPAVVTAMVEVLTGRWTVDEDEQRATAAFALGSAHSVAVLDLLYSARADASPAVRTAALQALSRTTDPRAGGALIAALADPDAWVRQGTISAIDISGRPDGIAVLIALIDAAQRGPVPLFLASEENQPWWVATEILGSGSYPFDPAQRAVLDLALNRQSWVKRIRRDALAIASSSYGTPYLELWWRR